MSSIARELTLRSPSVVMNYELPLDAKVVWGPVSVNKRQQPSSQSSGSCSALAAEDVFSVAPGNPPGISESQKSGLEGCLRGHYSSCHVRARSTLPQLFVSDLCS